MPARRCPGCRWPARRWTSRWPRRPGSRGRRTAARPDSLIPGGAMDVEVTDNPDKARFEIVADGELAGFVLYHLRDGVIAFTHTQTDDRFRGHGLGSRLVRASLDD